MIWYSYKTKDKKVRGYCTGQNKQEAKELIEKFAGYPIEELIVKRVIWDGEQFKGE